MISPQAPDRSVDVVSDDIDLLHEIGRSIAAADPLHAVLTRVVQFVSTVVASDSCFIYVLEEDDLVLRASKTPHPDVVDRLTLRVFGNQDTGQARLVATLDNLGKGASGAAVQNFNLMAGFDQTAGLTL